MDMAFEQKVRERAYGMWLAGGMADGLAHEHWVSAEQAVKSEVAKPTKTRVKAASVSVDGPALPRARKVAVKTATKTAPAKPSAKARVKAVN